MDLFVVPTASFQLLCGLLILEHGRRQIMWLGATAHPTAEWITRQLTEAYGWKAAPQYVVRDRDAVYGDIFIRRLRAMGIRDRPTAARSPWQKVGRHGHRPALQIFCRNLPVRLWVLRSGSLHRVDLRVAVGPRFAVDHDFELRSGSCSWPPRSPAIGLGLDTKAAARAMRE
jgi:hypothetical protein